MKTSHSLLLTALVSVAAFLIGSRTSADNGFDGKARAVSSRMQNGGSSADGADRRKEARAGREVLSIEKGTLLTSQERMALVKKAVLLSDPSRQADILCGLVPSMSTAEITETTRLLMAAQSLGHPWSQEVWNTVWTHWGKIDPKACLALTATGHGLNTGEDYRCMVSGWMETSPQDALAWAKQPGHSSREATAAAYAIITSANGDLRQMESAMSAISGDKPTTKACVQEYIDFAMSANPRETPDSIYDRLSPGLRDAAWPAVLERLAYTDPHAAAGWIEAHAGDPGRDYQSAFRLIDNLSQKDPQGTMEWATKLPLAGTPEQHPAGFAFGDWMKREPEAAMAWLRTQPDDGVWTYNLRVKAGVINQADR